MRVGRDGTLNGRGTHKGKEGKRFKWNRPPRDTGHPGEDYQCRCTAEPIIMV